MKKQIQSLRAIPVAAVIGFWLLGHGASTHAATVSVTPGSTTVSSGATFVVDLIGIGFDSGTLDGGGIDLSFDASVLKVLSVALDDDWEFAVPPASIDNSLGEVTGINFASFFERTGSLTFAKITFEALGPGTSSLGLAENNLSGFFTAGDPYPGLSFDQTALVQVNAVPIPGAAAMLLSALGCLLGARRFSRPFRIRN